MKTSKTHEAIDYQLEISQGKGFRTHLGASLIGRECARQLWYVFRWAKQVRHKARILRLFDRGNLEEDRFTLWLRKSGTHVLTHNLDDVDPETGKPRQFRVEDYNGHFGGSLDALLFDSPDFPGDWVLGEFKTHNDKSFKKLVKEGVRKAKFEHFVQMQIYMHKKGLKAAIYFAVNKNDDDLYTEVVYHEKEVAERYLDRAGKIIQATHPPEKINESPAWYICQWCDYKDVCHHGEPMRVSCRTCEHVRPVENAGWLCTRYDYLLSTQEQHRACEYHLPIRQ